ncbi:MAG: motile sperm domain-containing protein [Bacteroidales bacterium]|nr:motile sperm domain-containing protein [Bacteroidales bacterium]
MRENYRSIFILILFNILIILLISLQTRGNINSYSPGTEDDEKYNKGVTVSPSHLKFNVDMGKMKTKTIKITNYTDSKQKFRVKYNDFDISIDGKSSFLEAGTSDYSLSDLISISPTFIELEPGSAKEISITIQVPGGEEAAKAAWGVILIEQAEEKKVLDPGTQGGETIAFGITPIFSFGIWVYQNPPYVENNKVDIIDFIYDSENEQKLLILSAENKGDGIAFCKVYVELTSLNTGKQKSLGGQKYTLLPGYTRIFAFKVPGTLAKGNYSAVGVLDYNSDEEIVAAELELSIE